MVSNQERIYHVYHRRSGECVQNSLTVDELEGMIREGLINFSDHEIIVLTDIRNTTDHSY